MDLISFLSTLKNNPHYLVNQRIVVFHGKEYPLYFFYNFIKQIKNHLSSLETVAADTIETSHIIAQLQTSFLGSSRIYWFKNLDQLSNKKLKVLLDFFSSYTGPHTVLFYTTTPFKPDQKKQILVSLDDCVTQPLLKELGLFFDIKIASQLRDLIKRKQSRLTLDEACLCLHYLSLLGGKCNTFFDMWVPQIVSVHATLFSLSQHFFAQNTTQFFTLWSSIEKDYSEVFWITFWSDQLWRAYFYLLFSLQKKSFLAKQIATRLPFSFLNHDWRKYSAPHGFKHAHDFLYVLDFNIKTTKARYGLDLFYAKFFSGQFDFVNRDG